MRDGRREVHEHARAGDGYVPGGDYAKLFERDGVFGVGDAAEEVWGEYGPYFGGVGEEGRWKEGRVCVVCVGRRKLDQPYTSSASMSSRSSSLDGASSESFISHSSALADRGRRAVEGPAAGVSKMVGLRLSSGRDMALE